MSWTNVYTSVEDIVFEMSSNIAIATIELDKDDFLHTRYLVDEAQFAILQVSQSTPQSRMKTKSNMVIRGASKSSRSRMMRKMMKRTKRMKGLMPRPHQVHGCLKTNLGHLMSNHFNSTKVRGPRWDMLETPCHCTFASTSP